MMIVIFIVKIARFFDCFVWNLEDRKFCQLNINLSYTVKNLRSREGQIVEIFNFLLNELELLFYNGEILLLDGVNYIYKLFPALS